MVKTKWIIYTVIIGLIPFFIRTLITIFDKNGSINYWINESDIINFGLVLNLSVINELEDKDFEDKLWKTRNIGFSVVSLILLSSILAIVTYSDFKNNTDINRTAVKWCSFILATVNFIFTYSIYNRLNTLTR